jgi:cell division protein FtsL
METKLIVTLVCAAIFISATIWRECLIYIKNRKIRDLEEKVSELEMDLTCASNRNAELYECYMASLAREARRDGK